MTISQVRLRARGLAGETAMSQALIENLAAAVCFALNTAEAITVTL